MKLGTSTFAIIAIVLGIILLYFTSDISQKLKASCTAPNIQKSLNVLMMLSSIMIASSFSYFACQYTRTCPAGSGLGNFQSLYMWALVVISVFVLITSSVMLSAYNANLGTCKDSAVHSNMIWLVSLGTIGTVASAGMVYLHYSGKLE